MLRSIIFSAVFFLLQLSFACGQEAGTDPLQYSGSAWSPYLVGALIGLLTMLTFYFSNKPLGASTAYARFAGMLGNMVAPQHTKSLKYYQDNRPAIDWEVMLVIGASGGAFLAAWQGSDLTGEWLPSMWVSRFGEHSFALRTGLAMMGLGFGVACFGLFLREITPAGLTSQHHLRPTLYLQRPDEGNKPPACCGRSGCQQSHLIQAVDCNGRR